MKRILLPAFFVLLLSGSASLAATYFDVTVGLRVNEDSRIFLNVANETWRPSGPTTIIRQCADPEDDFPVIAFLAYHSHRSPASILRLRRAGYDWSEIFYRLDVSPRVLFVGIDRDPGPPYGKAWGYWRRQGDSSYGNSYYGRTSYGRTRFSLSDRDVVDLVKIQTTARHFGTSAYSVISAQGGSRRVDAYAANRWRERHGRNRWDRDDYYHDRNRRDYDRDRDHRHRDDYHRYDQDQRD
jgi:hypothetical protein